MLHGPHCGSICLKSQQATALGTIMNLGFSGGPPPPGTPSTDPWPWRSEGALGGDRRPKPASVPRLVHNLRYSRGAAPAPRRLISHARANSQSRLTVATDMPSDSAISSSRSPAKKRNSTTRADRVWSASSLFSSWSSASKSSRIGDGGARFGQGGPGCGRRPFFRVMFACIVDHQAAQLLRGQSEKVRAVAALDGFAGEQPQVQLVNQGRRLERVSGALMAKVMRGQAAKVGIDGGHQLVARLPVAVPPAVQQRR